MLKIQGLGWWPGTDLNRRRQPFQGCALPTELPGRDLVTSPHCSTRTIRSAVRRQNQNNTVPITISPADKPIHNPTAPSL